MFEDSLKFHKLGERVGATRIASRNTVKRIESVDRLSAVRRTAERKVFGQLEMKITRVTIGNSYISGTVSKKIENVD